MRITAKHLEGICSSINEALQKRGFVGRYAPQYCYGHTNIVFYSDPNSSGCSDVRCGLTKSEAYDVLIGIYHCLYSAMR